jgi:ELAV like protein 2/3/4
MSNSSYDPTDNDNNNNNAANSLINLYDASQPLNLSLLALSLPTEAKLDSNNLLSALVSPRSESLINSLQLNSPSSNLAGFSNFSVLNSPSHSSAAALSLIEQGYSQSVSTAASGTATPALYASYISPQPTTGQLLAYHKPKSGRNLHIDNLPSITENELRGLFQGFGPIIKARVVSDAVTSQHSGYGFVLFESEADALKAVREMNEFVLQGKILRVTLARPKHKGILEPGLMSGSNTNLYVSGLPTAYNRNQLDELFIPFGTILESRILTDKSSGESRGVGFVRFDSLSACDNAIKSLNCTQPSSCTQPLSVRFALDKGSNPLGAASPANFHSTTASSVASPQSSYLSLNYNSVNMAAAQLAAASPIPAALAAQQLFFPFSSPLASPTSAAAMHRAALFNSMHPALFNINTNLYHNYAQHQQQLIDAANQSRPSSNIPSLYSTPLTSPSNSAQRTHKQIQIQIQQLKQSAIAAREAKLSNNSPSANTDRHQKAQAAQLQSQIAAALTQSPVAAVSSSNPLSTSALPTTSNPATTLFVSHLHTSITETDLVELFEAFGGVISVAVIREAASNQSRGFGFVGLSNISECEMAIEFLNDTGIAGKQLKVLFKR